MISKMIVNLSIWSRYITVSSAVSDDSVSARFLLGSTTGVSPLIRQ